MSKLSQELRALFYLNQRIGKEKFISISEIANYLEVSHRQARRYMEDLYTILEIPISTKKGLNGGYKLDKGLDKGIALSDNIVLAMSIAMKRNERIEKILTELPQYVITEAVEGDNSIDGTTMDNLEVLITAIQNRRKVSFKYRNYEGNFEVDPYKLFYTNHSYYLCADDKGKTKHYDVQKICFLHILNDYAFDKNKEEQILSSLGKYGIRKGREASMVVKCIDIDSLNLFDRYFEGKGKMNINDLTYEVVGNNEHELYYPLFRISTKRYKFIDEDFKKRYIYYLYNQIRSLKRQ